MGDIAAHIPLPFDRPTVGTRANEQWIAAMARFKANSFDADLVNEGGQWVCRFAKPENDGDYTPTTYTANAIPLLISLLVEDGLIK